LSDDMTRPTGGDPTRSAAPGEESPRPEPLRIGRYRVVRLLGEGGMGRVYEAEQDQPRRTVALKVVKPGLVSTETLLRFDREAHVLGRLQHPGIAAIHDAGTADTGQGPQPYFAMEYVRGRSLIEHADASGLDVRARVELMARVADAVEHAHRKGVIHRDLKPGNILVDESGQPKVLDFGVARVTDADHLAATMRTDLGQLVGTIPYMSPEQVQADPDGLDTRSDVYALGVLLYQLLSGRLPYAADRRSVPDSLRAILEDDPAPLRSIHRSLRGDLETIVATALDKDRERRYGSAAELAAELRRYLAEEPILAHPPSTLYQVRKFARRNRVLVGGVAAVFVALVLGLAVSLTQAWRATRAERLASARLEQAQAQQREAEAARRTATTQRQRAEDNEALATSEAERARREAARAEEEAVRAHLAELTARDEADKSIAVTGFLQEMLAAANPTTATAWDTVRGKDVTVRDVLDEAGRRLDAGTLSGQPTTEAEARRTLGSTYRELGFYGKAEPHLTRSVDLWSARPAEDARVVLERARSLDGLAALRQQMGQLAAAESLYRESLALRRTALPALDTLVIRSVGNLAVAVHEQFRLAEAESLYRQTLALEARAPVRSPRDRMEALSNLGNLLQEAHRPDEAEPLLREALALRRARQGSRHPGTASTLESLAKVRIQRGDPVEGEKLLREAAETWGLALGEDHPYYATALANLGLRLRDQGHLDEAEALLRRALDIARAAMGDDDRQVAAMRYNYGRVLQGQGKLAAAETEFAGALAVMERALPADHPSLTAARSGLGSIKSDLGRPAEGEPLLREALATYRRTLPAGSWQIGQVLSVLGGNVAAQGRFAEAESLLVQGHGILVASTAAPADRKHLATERLVRLYEDWARAEPGPARQEALTAWQARLSEADSTRAR
jgi:tetratricopeptide (TPR) repeat protein